MKRVDLKERDLLFFKWLYKVSVLDKDLIMEIMNMSSDSYFYERMRKLERFGLIESYRQDMYSSKVYFLTQKGLNEIVDVEMRISKNNKVYAYRPKPATFNVHQYRHELVVARVLFDINKIFNDLDLFKTDREIRIELRKKKGNKNEYKKIPDIRIPFLGIDIEVELSLKSKSLMFDKAYRRRSDKLIWIIPKKNTTLEKRLRADNYMGRWKIFYLEELENIDWNFLLLEELEKLKENHKERLEEIEVSKIEIEKYKHEIKEETKRTNDRIKVLKEDINTLETSFNSFFIKAQKKKKEQLEEQLRDKKSSLHSLEHNHYSINKLRERLDYHEKQCKNYKEIVEEIEEKITNIQRMIGYMTQETEKKE